MDITTYMAAFAAKNVFNKVKELLGVFSKCCVNQCTSMSKLDISSMLTRALSAAVMCV